MFERVKGNNKSAIPVIGEAEEVEGCSIRKSPRGGFQVTTRKGVTEKFKSRKAAAKRVRQVQFFKRQG